MESSTVIERNWGFKVYEGADKYGFISYKREDSAIVAKYAKALSDKGENLWYDYGIAAGKWEDTISEKVMGAAYLIVFVTRRIFDSEEIKKEVKTAKARGIDIIPVFIENVDTTQIDPKRATFLIELQIMQGVPAFNMWSEQEVADELFRLITTKTAFEENIMFAPEPQVTGAGPRMLVGEELSECVGVLYDMEQSMLCQKKTMINLIEKTNELGQAQRFTKPIEPKKQTYPQKQAYPQKVYPQEPEFHFKFLYDDTDAIISSCLIELVVTVITAIAMIRWGLSTKGIEIVFIIPFGFFVVIVVFCLFSGFENFLARLFASTLSFPFRFLKCRSKYNNEMQEYYNQIRNIDVNYDNQVRLIETNYSNQLRIIEVNHSKAMAQYEQDMRNYRECVRQDDLRVQEENLQIQAINNNISLLLQKYSDTGELLGKLYDASPINVNYRHIIPLGYMNELTKLRVSNRLDTKDGLNYLVRSELSNKQIMSEIDDVITDFNSLVGNKMMMYYDLKQQFEKAKKSLMTLPV